MKGQERWRGAAFFGRSSKLATNSFRIALPFDQAERNYNLKLLREESWFDTPIVYGDGTGAIIVLEKGPAGERAFASAFTVWRQILVSSRFGMSVHRTSQLRGLRGWDSQPFYCRDARSMLEVSQNGPPSLVPGGD
jgi:hypothetical protein